MAKDTGQLLLPEGGATTAENENLAKDMVQLLFKERGTRESDSNSFLSLDPLVR